MQAERLNKKIGKSFLYMGNQITINNYTEKNGKISIATQTGFIDIKTEELTEFIDSLEPVSNELSVQVIPQMQINSSVVGQLKDVLMDNIKKLQADKSFLEQACEINNQVKSFIDLAKAEIEMVKLIKGK